MTASTERDHVTVYKVFRVGEGGKHAVYTKWCEVESEFDGAEFGDRIIVEMASMTEQEVKDLPDFKGW